MATWVAFLRAINLGANRKFPPPAVRAATEAAGFSGVATHINTGNVRLETRIRTRTRIEAALEAGYLADRGFAVPTVAFTAAELLGVVAEAEQLGEGHEGRQYVSLLKAEADPDAAAELEARSADGARVVVRDRAVHLLLGESYLGSGLDNAVVERLLGVATNRNLTVLRAVAARWC